MLGIGLGGFVDGFQQGYGIRQQMEEDKLRREQLEDEREQKERMDALRTDARDTFNEGVESGEFQPEQFGEFWRSYALPRMVNEMIVQGDVDQAQALQQWGESQAAVEGGKLFGSAMFKAQTGDPGGALQDVIEAGKTQGYIEHGFEFQGQEEITDADGNVVGYRMTLKDQDGEEIVQDIAADDVGSVIAQFANPQAAWQSQRERQMAEQERQTTRREDLEDYATKAAIDDAYDDDGTGNQAQLREDAIKSLRERMEPDPLNPDQPAFDQLSREEQERLIDEEIQLQTGQRRPEAPEGQVIVDTDSGQPVETPPVPGIAPRPAPAQAAPAGAATRGGGGAPGIRVTGTNPRPRETPQRPSGPASEQRGSGARTNPSADVSTRPQQRDRSQILDNAARMMVEGEDPNRIADSLTRMGIAREEWPSQLRTVVTMGAGR